MSDKTQTQYTTCGCTRDEDGTDNSECGLLDCSYQEDIVDYIQRLIAEVEAEVAAVPPEYINQRVEVENALFILQGALNHFDPKREIRM